MSHNIVPDLRFTKVTENFIRPSLVWEHSTMRDRKWPNAYYATKESREECLNLCRKTRFGNVEFHLASSIDTLSIHTATLKQFCWYHLRKSSKIDLQASGLCTIETLEIKINRFEEIMMLFNPTGNVGAREFIDFFQNLRRVHLAWLGGRNQRKARVWGEADSFKKVRELIIAHFKTMVDRGVCKNIPEITVAPRYSHYKSQERLWTSIRLMFERAENW